MIHKIERMEIFEQVSYDVKVDMATATTYASQLYRTLQLVKIIQIDPSHMVDKVELLENDGGVETILELTYLGG